MATLEAKRAVKRPGTFFWVLTALLCAYVALCTGQRDNVREADAWEHHRAIAALKANFWHPGNPTFATEEPSIRYSPYTVALAAFSRGTGLDAWHSLSAAAVANTLLLALGAWAVLRGLGCPEASGMALLVMVSLYGGAPGYANSYALADLPWHQVNPSAFAFAIVLLAWGLFLRPLAPGRAVWGWMVLPVLLSVALLDHPMTGLVGLLGLAVFAALGPGTNVQSERFRRLGLAATVGALALAACFAWPWYSFGQALTLRPDNDYWFNATIARVMLTQWCAPAVLLSLWALTARDRAAVRVLLAGGAACMAAGIAGTAVHSATLARIPLPGLIFFHLAIAITAYDAGLFRASEWVNRGRALLQGGTAAAGGALATVATAMMVYFLIPQLLAIPREPHLGRAWIATLIHRPDKQANFRELYGDLLSPISRGDVVFGDPTTTWPVPSFGGRIVAAVHYEFFTPGQQEREGDAYRFFSTDSETERRELLERYHARWLVVDSTRLSEAQRGGLIRERAVVSRSGSMVLMDAAAWTQ
jgi:hypothetical protein